MNTIYPGLVSYQVSDNVSGDVFGSYRFNPSLRLKSIDYEGTVSFDLGIDVGEIVQHLLYNWLK